MKRWMIAQARGRKMYLSDSPASSFAEPGEGCTIVGTARARMRSKQQNELKKKQATSVASTK